jgi:hypothetical protein
MLISRKPVISIEMRIILLDRQLNSKIIMIIKLHQALLLLLVEYNRILIKLMSILVK